LLGSVSSVDEPEQVDLLPGITGVLRQRHLQEVAPPGEGKLSLLYDRVAGVVEACDAIVDRRIGGNILIREHERGAAGGDGRVESPFEIQVRVVALRLQ